MGSAGVDVGTWCKFANGASIFASLLTVDLFIFSAGVGVTIGANLIYSRPRRRVAFVMYPFILFIGCYKKNNNRLASTDGGRCYDTFYDRKTHDY